MTTIQRKISLSIHCQLLKISGGESGPKNKERKKIFQGLDLKFLLNFEVHLLPFENVKVLADLQKESPPFSLGEFQLAFLQKK